MNQRRQFFGRSFGRSRDDVLRLFALLVTLLAAAAAHGEAGVDPRAPLIQHQLNRDHGAALIAVDQLIAVDPRAREMGLEYLRAHLLLQLERRGEALEAFASTMSSTPALEPYSRYRLAVEQEAMGHPEVAAGLVATLIGDRPPKSLLTSSVRLLERNLRHGGDCRLLGGLSHLRLGGKNRRRMDLAAANCAHREGQPAAAGRQWLALLRADTRDEVAQLAATGLAADLDFATARAVDLLYIGLSFHHHREFPKAIRYLSLALNSRQKVAPLSRAQVFEGRYARARSHFWLGNYPQAAVEFAALARDSSSPSQSAQALYQRARCLELQGRDHWAVAAAAYRRALDVEPTGRWASAALIGELRLRWHQGQETEALNGVGELLKKRKHEVASRAMLFLASSDLVQGRVDRAEQWLETTGQLNRVSRSEQAYWRGRLELERGRLEPATDILINTLAIDPFHPLAAAARRQLNTPALSQRARSKAQALAQSKRPRDLYRSWLLLQDDDPVGAQARQQLETLIAADAQSARYLRIEAKPISQWPLWRATFDRPEEKLLGMGLFGEGESIVLRHFPISDPNLAFTGSMALANSGAVRRSLYVAEILKKRIPSQLPLALMPEEYRRLLFPFSYSFLIMREAQRRGIDPYLLAALIREESRFDPDAFSAAAARGLTQFIYPTAQEIAAKIKLGPLQPEDIHRPEIAVALGAGYLEQLSSEFNGSLEQMVAAYNAGEPQSALWRSHCFSDEPEEYLTKVSFRETRNYLTKVLTSRAHYVALYSTRQRQAPATEADGRGH